MRQPEKFICISYPQIDFLIPNDSILSAVGVKDLDVALLHDKESGFFDFERIAEVFMQPSRETDIKTMVVIRGENNEQVSLVTTQECKVCTIKLREFSLFPDCYSSYFRDFGILACSFQESRIRYLIDASKMVRYMDDRLVEEL